MQVLPRGEHSRLEAVKRVARAAFAPEQGGAYAVWAERPLPPLLLVYASLDLCHRFKIRDKHVRTKADASDAAAASGSGVYALGDVMPETEERLKKTYERRDPPWPYGCARRNLRL